MNQICPPLCRIALIMISRESMWGVTAMNMTESLALLGVSAALLLFSVVGMAIYFLIREPL
jgi:hypothetical protein